MQPSSCAKCFDCAITAPLSSAMRRHCQRQFMSASSTHAAANSQPIGRSRPFNTLSIPLEARLRPIEPGGPEIGRVRVTGKAVRSSIGDTFTKAGETPIGGLYRAVFGGTAPRPIPRDIAQSARGLGDELPIHFNSSLSTRDCADRTLERLRFQSQRVSRPDSAISAARSSAFALFWVSCHSASGCESATIPPPACT
jgi:hypothetical protein